MYVCNLIFINKFFLHHQLIIYYETYITFKVIIMIVEHI